MEKLIAEKFNEAVKRISKSTSKEFDRRRPPTIYHYTSTEGLIGILSTGKMWFTDIMYMNDSSELKYAIELIDSVIEDRVKRHTNELFSEVLKGTWNFHHDFSDIYILCFTADGDLLSQWRAYGESGNGYAIGFDTKVNNYLGLLSKVEYIPEKQTLIINKIIDKIYNIFNDELNNYGNLQHKELLVHLSTNSINKLLSDIALRFKHPSFAEEKEWRLLYIVDYFADDFLDYDFLNLNFRCSNGRLIPFMNLGLTMNHDNEVCKLPINKIIHGPAVNPHLTQKALEQIIGKYKYSNVKIGGSSVPLRI